MLMLYLDRGSHGGWRGKPKGGRGLAGGWPGVGRGWQGVAGVDLWWLGWPRRPWVARAGVCQGSQGKPGGIQKGQGKTGKPGVVGECCGTPGEDGWVVRVPIQSQRLVVVRDYERKARSALRFIINFLTFKLLVTFVFIRNFILGCVWGCCFQHFHEIWWKNAHTTSKFTFPPTVFDLRQKINDIVQFWRIISKLYYFLWNICVALKAYLKEKWKNGL